MANPNLADRLNPVHLMGAGVETTEDLKKRVEEAVQPKPSADDEKKTRMRQRRYTFDFSFQTKRGEEFKGTFTSVIPDIRTREMIGVFRAQLAGGTPFASLDPNTNELNFIIANLAYMLEPAGSGPDGKATFPEWAKDLRALVDVDVLYALFEEVSAHEATFLGRV